MMMKHFTAAQQTTPGSHCGNGARPCSPAALAAITGGSGLSGAAGSGDGGDSDGNIVRIEAGEGFQSRLLEALIGAQPGDIVEIPEGSFQPDQRDQPGCRQCHDPRPGPRQNQSWTSGGQLSGGESVLVTSNNVTLERLRCGQPAFGWRQVQTQQRGHDEGLACRVDLRRVRGKRRLRSLPGADRKCAD